MAAADGEDVLWWRRRTQRMGAAAADVEERRRRRLARERDVRERERSIGEEAANLR